LPPSLTRPTHWPPSVTPGHAAGPHVDLGLDPV
jgi:hypothetical protein